MVAFADDLEVLLKVRKLRTMEEKFRAVIDMATSWCSEAGLYLAGEKNEVILLTGKRIPKDFSFDVGDGGGGDFHLQSGEIPRCDAR